MSVFVALTTSFENDVAREPARCTRVQGVLSATLLAELLPERGQRFRLAALHLRLDSPERLADGLVPAAEDLVRALGAERPVEETAFRDLLEPLHAERGAETAEALPHARVANRREPEAPPALGRAADLDGQLRLAARVADDRATTHERGTHHETGREVNRAAGVAVRLLDPELGLWRDVLRDVREDVVGHGASLLHQMTDGDLQLANLRADRVRPLLLLGLTRGALGLLLGGLRHRRRSPDRLAPDRDDRGGGGLDDGGRRELGGELRVETRELGRDDLDRRARVDPERPILIESPCELDRRLDGGEAVDAKDVSVRADEPARGDLLVLDQRTQGASEGLVAARGGDSHPVAMDLLEGLTAEEGVLGREMNLMAGGTGSRGAGREREVHGRH